MLGLYFGSCLKTFKSGVDDLVFVLNIWRITVVEREKESEKNRESEKNSEKE